MQRTTCASLKMTCGFIRASQSSNWVGSDFGRLGTKGCPMTSAGYRTGPVPVRFHRFQRRRDGRYLERRRGEQKGEDDLAYIDDVQVSDDPEEQCEGHEDSTGSGAEGSGDGVRDVLSRGVPEGRFDSVTRLGAQAANTLEVVRCQVEQLTKGAMAQERKAKENELRLLESERQRRLAEKHLRSAMRDLDEAEHERVHPFEKPLVPVSVLQDVGGEDGVNVRLRFEPEGGHPAYRSRNDED
ncbi:hypothetical protein AXF42_Ash015286 [Apostasia shenzhenica]|uniref:Uncharacterized protein n=1 Tax=Apostasia shenzhenica TaxID=1088818 RepID=A0A2I0ALT3_9ASPA|nr:hypothetical protein AXF42_Ash015286 [Apostasia shenzhenica]